MKALVFVFGLAVFATPVHAVPISFTGAEFVNLPGISFFSGVRTIMGDSLHIRATENNDVILGLSLDQFNVDVSDFEVQFSITRLRTQNGFDIQNPTIHLSDGRNLFGAAFFAGSDTTLRAGAMREELAGDGQSLIFREELQNSGTTPVANNESYLATIRILASAFETEVIADLDNGSAVARGTTSTRFNPSNGGASLLLASGPIGANYLIHSVTFTRGVSAPRAVVEPGTLGGLALGLMGLGFGNYRRLKLPGNLG